MNNDGWNWSAPSHERMHLSEPTVWVSGDEKGRWMKCECNEQAIIHNINRQFGKIQNKLINSLIENEFAAGKRINLKFAELNLVWFMNLPIAVLL